jgi:hypothetical protein
MAQFYFADGVEGFVPTTLDVDMLLGADDLVIETPAIFVYDYPFQEPYIRMYNGGPMSRAEAAATVADEFVEVLGDDADLYAITSLDSITLADIYDRLGGYALDLQRQIGYDQDAPLYLVVAQGA